jgi:hypothetical protein
MMLAHGKVDKIVIGLLVYALACMVSVVTLIATLVCRRRSTILVVLSSASVLFGTVSTAWVLKDKFEWTPDMWFFIIPFSAGLISLIRLETIRREKPEG